jgi:hypothetical protein
MPHSCVCRWLALCTRSRWPTRCPRRTALSPFAPSHRHRAPLAPAEVLIFVHLCHPSHVKADCECALGYEGQLTFDLSDQTWLGSCEALACPANASGSALLCVCDPTTHDELRFDAEVVALLLADKSRAMCNYVCSGMLRQTPGSARAWRPRACSKYTCTRAQTYTCMHTHTNANTCAGGPVSCSNSTLIQYVNTHVFQVTLNTADTRTSYIRSYPC